MPTAQTLITDALIELGIVQENDVPAGGDADRGLRLLNREIMDPWNVVKPFSLGSVFTEGTFAASTQTRLIGPSGGGSFVLTPRPVRLVSAARIESDVAYPIRVWNGAEGAKWYAGLNLPEFTSTLITDIYYDPRLSTTEGTMYPWPIPTAANTVRVETQGVMTQFTALSTSLNFAPGYESAVFNTLKEVLAEAFGVPMSEPALRRAQNSRYRIGIQNIKEPRRLRTDAPSNVVAVGDDPNAFRTRSF